jgi:aarF domain-containing kinase
MRVLTTEWINGAKLTSDAPSLKPEHVAIGVDAFATMVLDIGMVHADPHAGNFLITPDNEIALLDFGMVVEVPASHRLAWARCLYSLIRGDHNGTLDSLIEVGMFPADCPRGRVLEIMPKIWTELVAAGSDIKKRKVALKECFNELFVFVREFEFDLPDYYLALGRAVLTLEGIALAADMEFDIFKEALPMVVRFLASQTKVKTSELARKVSHKMAMSAIGCTKRLKGSVTKASSLDASRYALLAACGSFGLGTVLVTQAHGQTL